ncbi:hypothetical protein [Moraxella sp. E6BC]|uniref:hypothetical protein n=1 Tax=Moraxella sp. E6BC TaxID=3278712 RepID=UPI00359CDF56
MSLKNRIVLVVGSIVSMVFYGLYLKYQVYDKSFEKANPYLILSKHYNIPTKEELEMIVNEMINYEQSPFGDFYAGNSRSFSRSFKHDITEKVKLEARKQNLVKLETLQDRDVYCKGEIQIESGVDLDIRTHKKTFFVKASWSPRNKCRKYWWGGKNPRALQQKP